MDKLIALDKQLLLALNGSNSIFWDSVMWIISSTSTWSFVLFVLLYVIVKNSQWRQLLLAIACMALLVLCADQLSASVMKPYFHRLRPTHTPELYDYVKIVNGYRGGSYGFVSSHAANVFAVFAFVSMLLRHRLWSFFMFVWACVIGYSRIYMGVHYPGDVLSGALLGCMLGLVFYLIYSFINKKISADRTYFSNTYTSTGYLISDIHLLILSLMITYAYVTMRAVLRASFL